MSDDRLRLLERRWLSSGALEDRKAYEAARIRAGLEALPRLNIVHYVDDKFHGYFKGGKVDLGEDTARRRQVVILSRCSVELWPRGAGWYGIKMKPVHHTEIIDEVTCKRCLASLNKPDERVRYRSHYAPGSWDGRNRKITPAPVCGRDDSERFTQTFTYRMTEVNCPACRRIMTMGRRASRKPLLPK